MAGGVLIRDTSGNIVGAVGVTGDPDNDEELAIAAIEAVGLAMTSDSFNVLRVVS